ncbi:ZIP family metal transporter [Methanobacterium ferruginis]|jgi:ZIP family zinc transporter|uniref:ZIP family metal transporter n=1 Tax=Methanobacterium ferruginis TaxID=710191 RepID=UPI0025722A27|nr:ZIP family metal transporter [Methanobacterium ferruginis]MCC7550319.1 ZIP family metal transporter [Methanobacterium sp.]BDZ68119.1 zinc transporter [Methanobacterium ferruginis]
MNYILDYPPVILALLATMFTWLMTALGASIVLFVRDVNRKLLNASLGFAAGVMMAASYWSLLAPAIELSEPLGAFKWLPPALGFLMGGLFLASVDRILPHLHPGCALDEAEGIKTTWHRNRLLVLAVTLHNIPEGLAVGVVFGALTMETSYAALVAALALAIGIGIQNIPEGVAISLPLRGEGLSRKKSFFYGQLSGFVEPVAGVIGALLVTMFTPILPYALSFAAGAMIFVVIEDIIPECQQDKDIDLATVAAMAGFIIMMVLDVALG